MSGNSQHLAEAIAGWWTEGEPTAAPARSETTDLVPLSALQTTRVAIFVIPTWGQGEIPAPAEPLFAALQAAPEGSLAGLTYALVAPGDRSYPDYCGAGRLFDAALQRCGARRVGAILCLDGIPMERHYQPVMGWLGGVRPQLTSWAAQATNTEF